MPAMIIAAAAMVLPLTEARAEDSDRAPPAPTTCVSYETRVRYVMGYDHLVDIKNNCPARVSCNVSTNVNPKKQTVSLTPGESTSVLTFRGSPAREFSATVDCAYEK